MSQPPPLGLLKEDPDSCGGEEGEPQSISTRTGRDDQDAAAEDAFRTAKLMDGVVWDGKDAKKYAGNFKIKVA